MKLSARNQIAGTIVAIAPGAVNGSIKVDIGGGNVVTSSTGSAARKHVLSAATGLLGAAALAACVL